MSKSVVTARISEQLSADLDELAGRRERSRAWLIERAIAGFVADELELYRSLDEAEAQIDRGEYTTQVQVEAMFAMRRAEAQPG